ncbi:SgcJ/EcaC family oxidoreductase [Phaeacidiphilus oryzae]|uniref:SgcJ/EcaC family oxidoreductase n=1 Tax=Phaeacidiphilus oryzae TaxID=348818 RepID=UPI00056C1617|nr:SgcJ/EcaC family oxidoreductase [Phaeacidiphilus oryzae]
MSDESVERRAIRELGQRLQDAWNRGDAVGYASCFTEDASFVAWNGERGFGREAIAAAHRPLFAGPLAGSRMSLTDRRLGGRHLRFVREDVAIVVAPGVVTRAGEDPERPEHASVQTFVLTRDAERRWRVAAFQNTRRSAA